MVTNFEDYHAEIIFALVSEHCHNNYKFSAKCLPGASVSVGACGGKSENGNKEQEDNNENEVNQSTPHHPCDESEAKVCAANRGACYPPHLIKDKIKNPEPDGVVKIQSKCT